MDIVYEDSKIIVCVKPAGILSTDEPGGMPEFIKAEKQDETLHIRTVHRLDRVVSGLMVFAKTRTAATRLSEQMRNNLFDKEYLAVIHGKPLRNQDTLTDLLYRDKSERKTYVVTERSKGVQEAVLSYELLQTNETMSLVKIKLHTGRTHQIRVQFSSRSMPLIGDKKYSEKQDDCDIALWSHFLSFQHPSSFEPMAFSLLPPDKYPWNGFQMRQVDSSESTLE